MDFLPLISIPIIFLLVVIAKPSASTRTSWNICAICVAVSVTWICLFTLLWMGIMRNTTPIAILMGMSVIGFMYKIEAYYQMHGLHHLWISRLVVVMGGFLVIMLLLAQNWQGVALSGIGSILSLVIITFLTQGTTHKEAVESANKDVKKSLLKKLDNCC